MSVEEIEEKNASIQRKVMKYFGLFMAVAYLTIGVIIVLIPNDAVGITPFQKNGVGVLFILYSFYRFYKVYRLYFRRKAPNE